MIKEKLKQLEEERLEPLLLEFGDVIETTNGQKAVVIESNNECLCGASIILKSDKEKKLSLPGSFSRIEVKKINGHWTKEEVVGAFKSLFPFQSYAINAFFDNLEKCANCSKFFLKDGHD